MTLRTLVPGVAFLLMALAPSSQAADEEASEHADHTPPVSTSPQDPRSGIAAVEALMGRITASTDTGERRQLLAQHLGALRDQMRLVRTAQAPATGEDPHAGHAAEAGSSNGGDKMARKMKGGGMMKMHKKVEARIDMLERMLQQLIEHEAVEREMEEE